jgi:hypothetical protein
MCGGCWEIGRDEEEESRFASREKPMKIGGCTAALAKIEMI